MQKWSERFSEAFPKLWWPKVTTKQEAKYLNTLSLDALIGSFKIHEIVIIEAHENVLRKGKCSSEVFSEDSWSKHNAMASKDFDEEASREKDDEEIFLKFGRRGLKWRKDPSKREIKKKKI